MNLNDLKVGDKVFVAAQNSKRQNHYTGTVSKIGRKYITVLKEGWTAYGLEFYIKDGYEKSDVSPTFRLYRSEQDYKDYLKCVELKRELSHYISSSTDISLNILLEIKQLLKLKE